MTFFKIIWGGEVVEAMAGRARHGLNHLSSCFSFKKPIHCHSERSEESFKFNNSFAFKENFSISTLNSH
jgi:hypothetical protein